MEKYQIGANPVPVKTSEAIADIENNRTLFVQQLTKEVPPVPEAVHNLRTSKDVFDYFKPSVSVEFEKEDGSVSTEDIQFTDLGDFKPKNIVEKSDYLKQMALSLKANETIQKRLKTNRVLAKLLKTPEKKEALIKLLGVMASELGENDSNAEETKGQS